MSFKNNIFKFFRNFSKGYNRMSVRWALMFFMLLGLVLPFIIFSTFTFKYVNNFMYDILMDSTNQSVQNNSTQLESIVENLNFTAAFLSTNPYIIEQILIMDNNENTAKAIIARDNLIKYIKDISNVALNTSNPRITVVTKKGKVVEIDNRIYSLSINFNKLITYNFNGNRIVWDNLLNPMLSTSLKSTWIIRGLGEQKDAVGLIIIEIPGDVLWNKLSSHSFLSSTEMMINDTSGNTICVNNISNNNSNFKNHISPDSDNITICTPIGSCGLNLYTLTPFNIIAKQLILFRNIILLCFFVLIMILLLIVNSISKYISQPIVLLTEYIHKVQLGKFYENPHEVYFKDMTVLSENMVEVSQHIDELMKTTVDQAIAKEKMRFDALKSQINPHFLYNTLNSIKWMATINGDYIVANMITDLGKLLNNVLGKNGETTTLKEELDILNSYISLQKMRYGETFIYEVNVDNELMDCILPRFSLQPLVENAIVHGILSKNNGLISIFIHKEDDMLIISVKDNGSGMNNTEAQKLLKSSTFSGGNKGIGITNVNDRIQIMFGCKYGLRIHSDVDKGFTISMLIPYNLNTNQKC